MKNKIGGGPVCEHQGHNVEIPSCPRIGNCKDCDGIQPLSEWTDAQKAEWLKNNAPHPYRKGNTPIFPDELEINVAVGAHPQTWYVEYRTGPHPYDDDHAVLGEGEDFSAALTAAVIAVAKESNETRD